MKASLLNQDISEFAENLKDLQFSTNSLNIQINCVIRVLKESIEHVKISLILPHILENPNAVKSYLIGTIYEPALSLLDEFALRRDIIVKKQWAPLSDHGMIKIIDYFIAHYKMHELLPHLFDKLTIHDRNLLITFERLFQVCEQHLLRNARKLMTRERNLNKIYQENEEIKKSIIKMKESLAAQVIRERWRSAAKMVYLKMCEEKLVYKRQLNEQRMRDESEKCQHIILANRKDAAEDYNLLLVELEKVQKEYEKQVKSNQRDEDTARDEKSKLEINLQMIIQKYDKTICEKKIRSMDLNKKLEAATENFKKLMIKFNQTEVTYNEIVTKRQKDEEVAKSRRILVYMMNRAVRKIQRYWRKWRKHYMKKLNQLKKK